MADNQIMGAIATFKGLRVSYVSVGEWQTFGAALETDEVRAIREFIYCALHRAEPAVTRRWVRWWMRLHNAAVAPLVEFICNISVPDLPKADSPDRSVKEATREVESVFRVLSKMYGWAPDQISNMSPAQIHSYLSGGEDGTGIVKMSGAQYKSWRARRDGGQT